MTHYEPKSRLGLFPDDIQPIESKPRWSDGRKGASLSHLVLEMKNLIKDTLSYTSSRFVNGIKWFSFLIFQIFFFLAPKQYGFFSFFLLLFSHKGNITIILFRSAGDTTSEDDEKKDLFNFVQLSFTKIYRHLNFVPITSSHNFVSSHDCALISPRLHRWNFPDSKQRPSLHRLTLPRRTTKRFIRRLIFAPTRLGGEYPR